jgi:hypothetical protein
MNHKQKHGHIALDSKPFSIWHYGSAMTSDILSHGAVGEKTAQGTD